MSVNLIEKKAMWKAIEHIYDCIRQFNEAAESVKRTATVSSSLYELKTLLQTFSDPLTPQVICYKCERGFFEIIFSDPVKIPEGDDWAFIYNTKLICDNPNCKLELNGIVG